MGPPGRRCCPGGAPGTPAPSPLVGRGVPWRGRDGEGPCGKLGKHSWPRRGAGFSARVPRGLVRSGAAILGPGWHRAPASPSPGKLGRWVLPSSKGSLPAQPLPFPSLPGEQMAVPRLSAVGGQAGRAGGASGKSWQPLVPRGWALSGFQEVTFLPLHKEPLCVCIPLCPQTGPPDPAVTVAGEVLIAALPCVGLAACGPQIPSPRPQGVRDRAGVPARDLDS